MGAERTLPVVVRVHDGARTRPVKVGDALVGEDEVTLSLDLAMLEAAREVLAAHRAVSPKLRGKIPALGPSLATTPEDADAAPPPVAGGAAGALVEDPTVEARRAAARERQVADLEWLAQRSERALADPKKAKWHADLRAQLALIEAELTRLLQRERDASN